jgi:hypothetical protein
LDQKPARAQRRGLPTIARLITDEQTKEGLLALAAEYEAFAERRAGDAPPETQE